jgi:phosphoglucosamine mutase
MNASVIVKKYFGTDGVRGRVGDAVINADMMQKLGCAIGAVLCETSDKNPHVLIGRDTRESGEMLQAALVSGLIEKGVDVSLLGVISTPAVAYFTQVLHADAGIVISASHNPYHDNGVKVIGKNGSKLSDAWELKVESKIESADISGNKTSGKINSITDANEKYIAHSLNLFENSFSLKNKKIVLDCANGATSEIAPIIFSTLNAEIVLIHASPDGKNINEKCGATDLTNLQARVLQEKADCGVAFDGDGDRLMMVDHQGVRVDGDEILCILALYGKKQPAVVGTLMSNLGLEKAVKSQGMQFERVAVGDRYVLEKLQKNNWTLGGESSGHIINLDFASTGDGILTALQVLHIMQQKNKSLRDLKNSMKKRPQILINVPAKNPNRYTDIAEIQDAVKMIQNQLQDSGRVLLRASGTESCVRVMIECDEDAMARELAESLAKTVAACL